MPPQLFAQATDPALCRSLLENGADQVIYAPLDITEPAFSQTLFQLPDAAWVALPVQLTDMELSRLTAQIAAHGLRVCLGSAGQLPVCPPPMMAGEGVPVWNALASDLLLAQGAQWQTLPRELTARLRAVLRRSHPAAVSTQLELGDLCFSPVRGVVSIDEQEFALTVSESRLLEALLRQPGEPLDKQELAQIALGRKLTLYDRSLDMHVSNLRKKIGPHPDGRPRIVALRSRGYYYSL